MYSIVASFINKVLIGTQNIKSIKTTSVKICFLWYGYVSFCEIKYLKCKFSFIVISLLLILYSSDFSSEM